MRNKGYEVRIEEAGILYKQGVGEIDTENQWFLQATDSKRENERAEKTVAMAINIGKEDKKGVRRRHHTDTFRHTIWNEYIEKQ